jgi:hypothetical protein
LISKGDNTEDVLVQTGFDFRQGRAYPVLTGIVVAAENEELVVEVRIVGSFNLVFSFWEGLFGKCAE